MRGRRPKTCPVRERNEVNRFLSEVSGPVVGPAALRALFRGIPRCILEDLLRRYRRVWRWRYQQKGFRLTWLQAGSTWAMDFSEPLYPIDGIYPYLFAVRDLASHWQLAWCPFTGETALETIHVLVELFRRYGPPLVLKSDNGSAFIAESLAAVLQDWGVFQLFSPPRHPQYNGALERSNATLKTFTHQHAIHEGHLPLDERGCRPGAGSRQHAESTLGTSRGLAGRSLAGAHSHQGGGAGVVPGNRGTSAAQSGQ
jgi:transposase InsO family protein